MVPPPLSATSFALTRMLPALPGPLLLAEMDALFETVTDCPAFSAMLPPVPVAEAVVNTPPGVPSIIVPEIEIWFALTVISPPLPAVSVLLSIRPPWLRIRLPVVIDIGPAFPHGPIQFRL